MKTFLFITGLSCNIALCAYPFDQASEVATPIKETKDSEVVQENTINRKSLNYSDFLKNKAVQIKD